MEPLIQRRYEYMTVEIPESDLSLENREELNDEINSLGNTGWEMVSSHYVPQPGKGWLSAPDYEYKGFERYIFKRSKITF